MKLHIDLKHVASGPYFLASGKSRPDKYRFERLKGQEHIHRLTIPGDKAVEILDDLALRLQQIDIPVILSFEMEDADLDTDGILKQRDGLIAALERQLKQEQQRASTAERGLKGPKSKVAGDVITAEQLEMLKERDEMLEALKPHAGEDESPLDVVMRLTAKEAKAEAALTAEPPVAAAPAPEQPPPETTAPGPEAAPPPPPAKPPRVRKPGPAKKKRR